MNELKTKQEIAKLDRLAYALDSKFVVPGTQFRFGIDGLIGLIPIWGDFLSFILSLFIVAYIVRLGAPPSVVARICINTGFDFIVGLVPILGDVADVAFKCNSRNVALAKKYFERPQKVRRQSWLVLGTYIFLLLAIFVAFVSLIVWLTLKIWHWAFATG